MTGESFDVIVDPQADRDIALAYRHYLTINDLLAERFLAEVYKAFNSMGILWATHQVRYRDTRCWYLKKFPYSFHYRVLESEKKVLVSSFFHYKQHSLLG